MLYANIDIISTQLRINIMPYQLYFKLLKSSQRRDKHKICLRHYD